MRSAAIRREQGIGTAIGTAIQARQRRRAVSEYGFVWAYGVLIHVPVWYCTGRPGVRLLYAAGGLSAVGPAVG